MVLLNSTRRRDKKGNIIGVLGVGQETTDFFTYPNELELQVKQRTINLKDPLIGKKRLTELKYKFIATISHAYRTPLAPINFAAGFVNQYWAKTEPVAVAQN
jgi:signal transduction histidine kinase